MNINCIYNEDNLATCGRMPDGFIDLVVTSPPYDNLRTYNGFSWDFEALARELFRVVKKGGVVVWVVGDATVNGSETGTSFRQALYFKEIGFNLHDTMIYCTDKMVLNHNRYDPAFEYMFVFSKGAPASFNPLKTPNVNAGRVKRFNYSANSVAATMKESGSAYRWRDEQIVTKDDRLRRNVWFYQTGSMHTSVDAMAFQHPAVYPEALAKDHILSWSNENDIVYDPFMGSGTTAKAAHQLKRNWIGSEISSEYVELANKRLEPYLAQESLF